MQAIIPEEPNRILQSAEGRPRPLLPVLIQDQVFFIVGLLISLGHGIWGTISAFRSPNVIQDDARQHVVWMLRLQDPELFRNDWMAEYFGSVAPIGLKILYGVPAWVGISPLTTHKLLPLVLGFGATWFAMRITRAILPSKFGCLFTAFFLNQSLWLKDDLVSATARSFGCPLLLAFISFHLEDRWVPMAITVGLMGFFYPPLLPIPIGFLVLNWLFTKEKKWTAPKSLRTWGLIFFGIGLGLVFAGGAARFGPVVSVERAKEMFEFQEFGRTRFFVPKFREFWLFGERSGVFPMEWGYLPIPPPFVLLALALPFLLLLKKTQIAHSIKKEKLSALFKVIGISFFFFILAHVVLFKLYLPSRFTEHTFRALTPVLGGLSLTCLVGIFAEFGSPGKGRGILRFSILVVSVSLVISYPFVLRRASVGFFPRSNYVIGEETDLYNFFKSQPKSILIASLAEEANNLPAFSQRSILVGRECAIPYHEGYYQVISDRAGELLLAQYSPNISDLQSFIRKYKIDFILIEKNAFNPQYLSRNIWFRSFQPSMNKVVSMMGLGRKPALDLIGTQCLAFENKKYRVFNASEILNLH